MNNTLWKGAYATKVSQSGELSIPMWIDPFLLKKIERHTLPFILIILVMEQLKLSIPEANSHEHTFAEHFITRCYY